MLGASAVKKCRDGDYISDEELAAGIELLDIVIPALVQMGEVYYLVYSDLHRRREQLKDFQGARKCTQ